VPQGEPRAYSSGIARLRCPLPGTTLGAKTFEKHVISVQLPYLNTKTSPHFWVCHTNQPLFASGRSIAKSGVHAVFVLHICSGYDLKVSLATEKSGRVYRHYGSNIMTFTLLAYTARMHVGKLCFSQLFASIGDGHLPSSVLLAFVTVILCQVKWVLTGSRDPNCTISFTAAFDCREPYCNRSQVHTRSCGPSTFHYVCSLDGYQISQS
jgi:hypothetical protein